MLSQLMIYVAFVMIILVVTFLVIGTKMMYDLIKNMFIMAKISFKEKFSFFFKPLPEPEPSPAEQKALRKKQLENEYQTKMTTLKKQAPKEFDNLKAVRNWKDDVVNNHFNDKQFYRYCVDYLVRPIDHPPILVNNEEKREYLDTFLKLMNTIIPLEEDDSSEPLFFKEKLRKLINAELSQYTTFYLEHEEIMRIHYPKIYDFLTNKLTEYQNYLYSRYETISKEYHACDSGLRGEAYVNGELDIHQNWFNLKNIRVEVEGNSVENDNIILSPHGIFSLEVKNYGQSGAYKLVIQRDGQWKGVHENGTTFDIDNVNSQSTRHVAFLNRLINHHLNRGMDNYIDVQSIIVIANEKVSIENYSSNQVVLRASDVYNHVRKHPISFKQQDLLKIKTLLETNNLKPKRYEMLDFKTEILKNIKTFRKEFNEMKPLIKETQEKHIKINKRYQKAKTA